MPLDGITANFLSKELSSTLCDARVEKVYQKNLFEIYLKLRSKRTSCFLILSANPSSPRFHITSETFENPFLPMRFCSILRKYLTGAKILEINTSGYERIFNIKFQVLNELGDMSFNYLIVEIMGRHSNIILLNNDFTIMDSAVHVDSRVSSVREILPTRKYINPPSQNKLLPEESIELIKNKSFFDNSEDIKAEKYLLNKIMGFSPQLAKEICIGANIKSDTPMNLLDKESINSLSSFLLLYLNKIVSSSYEPAVFYKEQLLTNPYDFHAFIFSSALFYKKTESISQAMDLFYLYKSFQNNISQKKSHLNKVVQKSNNTIQNKIKAQNIELNECENSLMYKKYADLILSNIYKINPKSKYVIVDDYFENPVAQINIPLNPSQSPSQNAQYYYKKYRKLQSRFEYLSKAISKETKQAQYLKSLIISINNADDLEDLEIIREEMVIAKLITPKIEKMPYGKSKKAKKVKQKQTISIPRKFISSDGFEIYVGRNNLQNDKLTLKSSSSNDIWFHIQKEPGTHVVLRTNNNEATETSIKEAAMLAAWYSKNSQSAGLGVKLNIDYCRIKDVWKPKGSSLGHVLYKNFKTIFVEAVLPENITQISN